MAANLKYQNISVQPITVPRTAKPVYELPRLNLTDDELSRKSTSDRTKRRVAHVARFPLPVITKPIVAEKPPRKEIKKLIIKKDGSISFVKKKVASDRRVQHIQATSSDVVDKKSTSNRAKSSMEPLKQWFTVPVIPIEKLSFKKDGTSSSGIEGEISTSDKTKSSVETHKPCRPLPVDAEPKVAKKPQRQPMEKLVLKKNGGNWRVKPNEVRKTTETVVLDSLRAQHSQPSSSGADDSLNIVKRKSDGLGFDQVIKKKQKTAILTGQNKNKSHVYEKDKLDKVGMARPIAPWRG